MSIQVHITNSNEPIPTSAICSSCEGSALKRFQSYKWAQEDSQDYNGKARVIADKDSGIRCMFCGKKS